MDWLKLCGYHVRLSGKCEETARSDAKNKQAARGSHRAESRSCTSSRSHREDRCAAALRRCANARWSLQGEIRSVLRRRRERLIVSTRTWTKSLKQLQSLHRYIVTSLHDCEYKRVS